MGARLTGSQALELVRGVYARLAGSVNLWVVKASDEDETLESKKRHQRITRAHGYGEKSAGGLTQSLD